jgi:predicted nucleic acid-binding protein
MTFIDTSVIIDFLAGNEQIVSAIQALAKKGTIKTTTITEYELLKHSNELKRGIAEKFLSAITVCPFDRDSAKQAALLFEKLSENGTMINENDLLIAGITLAKSDVLLTRDKHFAYLKEPSIQII